MPLTIVDLILQQLADNVDFMDSGAIITEFLVEDMTLDQACALSPTGSTSLLELVWDRGLKSIESSNWSVAKLVHTNPHYRRWVFNRALLQAVRREELHMLQWLLDHFPSCPVTQDAITEIVKSGHRRCWELLRKNSDYPSTRWRVSIDVAARHGRWNLVHRLHDHCVLFQQEMKPSRKLVAWAFEQNNTEELKWSVEQGYHVSINHFPKYSEAGWETCKQNVRYLLGAQCDNIVKKRMVQSSLEQAARVGDLEFLQWLMRDYSCDTRSVVSCASQGGHIPVVRWLLENPKFTPTDFCAAMLEAADNGKLELMQWLYKQLGGDPAIKLFRDEPRPYIGCHSHFYPSTEMDVAANNGHLDVLQFLHQINMRTRNKRKQRDEHDQDEESTTNYKDYPRCTIRTMEWAAAYGHLDIVKWLHINRSEGCTSAAMDYAAANGHLEVVKWLHENRTEGCTTRAMDGAAQNGHLDVLQWLYERTVVRWSDDAMIGAAQRGHLAVVRWLHQHGSNECTTAALNAAAGYSKYDRVGRQLGVVQYLLHNSKDTDIAEALGKALYERHFEILLFLHEKQSNSTEQDPTISFEDLSTFSNRRDDEMRSWFEENYKPF